MHGASDKRGYYSSDLNIGDWQFSEVRDYLSLSLSAPVNDKFQRGTSGTAALAQIDTNYRVLFRTDDGDIIPDCFVINFRIVADSVPTLLLRV